MPSAPGGKGDKRRPTGPSYGDNYDAIFRNARTGVNAPDSPIQLFTNSHTFFDYDRWAAHAFMGELMANGIVDMAVSSDGPEITVRWASPLRPLVRVYPTDKT